MTQHPNIYQDVSKANIARPGLDGYQTSLCSHLFRLIKNTRVPWVIFENVGGLLQWHRDNGNERPPAIAYVCEELEKLGYSWAHRVVSLQGFGIPQRRTRVFIVASIHADPRDVLLSMETDCQGQCQEMFGRECYSCYGKPPHNSRRIASCLCPGESRIGPIVDETFTLTTGNIANMCIIKHIDDRTGVISGITIEDAEKLMGLPQGWTNPHGTEIPSSVRSKIIGLAVAVPQSEWLGQRLAKPHDMKFLRSGQGVPFDAKNQGEDGTAWPKAAWNILSPSTNNTWQSRRYLQINDTPEIAPFRPLGDFGLKADIEVPGSRIRTYLDKLDPTAKSKLDDYEFNAITTLLGENNYNFESDTDEHPISAPKKRGRPPNTPSPMPKKRGRPPNTPSPMPKKRGRPPNTPSPMPKHRGRPPKRAATGMEMVIDKQVVDPDDISQEPCSTNSSLKQTQITTDISSKCGLCKICKTNAIMFKTQSPRQKRRCSEAAYDNKRLESCPKVNIMSKARDGNKGAQLTLRREKAEGTKMQIYWSDDRKYYPATLAQFNPSDYTFKITHDDDTTVETLKLWEETLL